MLAPLSMNDVEYQLWRNGITYAERVTNELDYDEQYPPHALSHSCGICSSSSHLFPFFLHIVSHNDIQMEYLCQASPAASAPIDPPHLPWLIYAYGPNGFARMWWAATQMSWVTLSLRVHMRLLYKSTRSSSGLPGTSIWR
ncbi:hypothetical protein SO802_009161 [Lithocarpus litseifolius]|uniref:Uncharacterized protein n=1 Tax=Lithocarpus litseifolius TaxID=425828 RepID=A0AAW2DDG8_9ROSI